MMKIDLNMSDPLTLGLTIGMGHSTTERIRRLTMRKTNKMMRSGTAMIVLAGLGLSSSIVATAASEAVKAEKPQSDSAAILATLSLIPVTMDPTIETEMNRRIRGVLDGTLPGTAVSEWPGLQSGHIEVDVTTQGAGQATVRDTEGNAIEGVDKSEVLASLNPLLNLCSTHSKISSTSDYFIMTAGVPEIEYQATCTPKPKANQPSKLTVDEEIAIILADNDIPMSTRKAMARGMKAGTMARKYIAETPNPTRQQAYDYCIFSFGVLNEGFRYENMAKQADDEIAENCEESVTRDFGPRTK